MNVRTTLVLAIVLMGLLLVFVWQPAATESPASAPRPVTPAAAVERSVIDPALGDVVKITCRRRDGGEWVFEKRTSDAEGAASPTWHMTAPQEITVPSWEADRIARQLTGLKYEIAHRPGAAGAVSAAQAGLEPPDVIVTLNDADGRSAVVEIGRAASANDTYVRVAGSLDILVGKSSLRNLLKERPLDYRDLQLWNFAADKVTRVEVVDRTTEAEAVTYTFVRDGARWMMESPVVARATHKVNELLQAVGRLRAAQWENDRRERLASYGLDPAARTIRVTVEEEVPVAEEESDGAAASEEDENAAQPPKTEKKTTIHELHVSEQSPIGEDTKCYIRLNDEAAVASMMKTIADKLKPNLREWRDLKVTNANITAATRVESTTPEGSAALVRRDGVWWFEESDARAEDDRVSSLLNTIANLEAVVFADSPAAQPAMGFDAPQADVQVTLPAGEGVERFTIGGFTDPQSKLLVWLRRNGDVIAKVNAADVQPLLGGPLALRDRTIFQVPPGHISRIELSASNQLSDQRTQVTLERKDGAWAMVQPTHAPARQDRADRIAGTLASLKATAVVADEAELSAYGLHEPRATVTFTVTSPPEFRIEKKESATEDQSDAENEADGAGAETTDPQEMQPVEVQPPPATYSVAITLHDGKYYAKRGDRPAIYELADVVFNETMDEYRSDTVIQFEDPEVRTFTIRANEAQYTFERHEGSWVYVQEPDLRLDAKKVDNLLLQIRDLKTQRYVVHAGADLAAFDLTNPSVEARIGLEGGAEKWVAIAARTAPTDAARSHYATSSDNIGAVFLLTPDMKARLQPDLSQLQAK